MQTFLKLALALGAVIHLLPAVGALGASHLLRLYGVTATDPRLLLLLRHRAVLFGLLGALLLASLWIPALRTAALLAGVISAASYVWLAWQSPSLTPALARVAWIDAGLLVVLLPALVAQCGRGSLA